MDPNSYLLLLKERNDELSQRCTKLEKLSAKIDSSIENLQDLYEVLLSSQEQRCVEMVEFDEEIKTISKKLFPPMAERKVQLRGREENQELILQSFQHLAHLDEEACSKELLNSDPLLNAIRSDVDQLNAFLQKYENVIY